MSEIRVLEIAEEGAGKRVGEGLGDGSGVSGDVGVGVGLVGIVKVGVVGRDLGMVIGTDMFGDGIGEESGLSTGDETGFVRINVWGDIWDGIGLVEVVGLGVDGGESVCFVVGLGMSLGGVDEEISFVLGEDIVEEVEIRVGAAESVGFGTDKAFSFFTASHVPASTSTRLLTLTHSASTSATISPPPANESKLNMDEISPSSVLSLSLVDGLAAPLTSLLSSRVTWLSCDGGGCF